MITNCKGYILIMNQSEGHGVFFFLYIIRINKRDKREFINLPQNWMEHKEL
jgi:hypothetical protein